MKSVVFAVAGVLSLGSVYATNNVELINWRKNAYESKTPVLGEIPPGMRLSVRWEALRDGIEEFEKIALLRSGGADMTKIDAVLESIRSECELAVGDNPGKAKEHVGAITAAIAEAAKAFAKR